MRWQVVAVLVLALTAGCGSLASETGQTETVTPAPVPAVETTSSGPTLPPGVNGGGTIDVDRLAEAHLAALEKRSYVKRVERSFGNTSSTATLQVESTTRYRYEYAQPATGDRVSVFADGTVRYAWDRQFPSHLSRNDVTNVTISHRTETARAIRRYLDLSNATVAETLVNGELHYAVTAERDQYQGDSTTAGYRVEAVITPAGVVRTLNVSYVDRYKGRLVDVTYSHRYELRNVTLVRPDWVDRQFGDGNESVTGEVRPVG